MTPKQKQIAQAWRDVWGSPQGRLAVSELLLSLNVYSPIDTDNVLHAGMAIGERNVAARIAKWLDLKPSDYVEHAQDSVAELDELDKILRMKLGD